MPRFIEVDYNPWDGKHDERVDELDAYERWYSMSQPNTTPVGYNPWEGQVDPWGYRPVSDRVELAPGQYPTGRGGVDRNILLNDAGIYASPKPQPVEGDQVVYDPQAYPSFRYNDTKSNIYPSQSRRLYEDLAKQYSSGGLADPEAYKRILPYQDELLSQDKNMLGEALRGQDPSYLRRIGDFSYKPPVTPEDWDAVLQRPPVALNLPLATPPQAMFESPAFNLQGDYTRGKFFSPGTQLRGMYRYDTQF